MLLRELIAAGAKKVRRAVWHEEAYLVLLPGGEKGELHDPSPGGLPKGTVLDLHLDKDTEPNWELVE